jgi:DHA2 family multidrug resistance protein-like MFS transporter
VSALVKLRRRLKIPAFIREVIDDRAALRVLIAASGAMLAVGLDPLIFDPGMVTIQAAVRAEPDLKSAVMIVAVAKSGFLLLGGVLADNLRSERLMRISLLGLAAASLGAVLVPTGPGLLATRIVAAVCDGLVLPFALGAVAMAYSGSARATALGIAYAMFGAGTAAWPALVNLFGVDGPRAQAFLACGAAALVALLLAWRNLPDLPGAPRAQRPFIAATALWAFGVTAIVAALIDVELNLAGVIVTVAGAACVIAALRVLRRPTEHGERVSVDLRPVAVVLAVGIVVGFAQAIPMAKLPMFFRVIQGLSPILATIAIAPFVLALFVAGPVAGWLLTRIGARTLIAGGTVAIGLANIGFAAILGPAADYALFVLPFVLLGGGFVIATSVRTAVIFASVPRRLPASAAALNEASIGLGSRMGTVVATTTITQVSLNTYASSLGDLPGDVIERMLQPFRELQLALGFPSFPGLVELVDPEKLTAYVAAAIQGLRVALLIPGVVAVVVGVIAWFVLGHRDPVRSVWDHRDERIAGRAAQPSSATPQDDRITQTG